MPNTREKLIELVNDAQMNAHWHSAKNPTEYVVDMLIANGVTIPVRCKDCKHWKFIDSLNPHWECQIFCGLHEYGYLTGADDFCSYGERRSDG